ncbi:MAG: thioredoxin family protein [Balneola sp.]|jgi:thiol-disulfide isomerase/thioredoxin
MKFYSPFFLLAVVLCFPVYAQNDYLSGPVTEQQIREVKIFDLYTERYKPDSEIISGLNAIQDSVLVDVFMGMWCHDSKREIPAFFKIMESIDNPLITANYTALEYRRRGPKDIIKENNIKRTPTFIIYKNGKEVGRIIEEVEVSMESDLYQIIIKE